MEKNAGTEATMKALLESRLAAMFPDEFIRRRVHRVLQGYGTGVHEHEPGRVRLAILKLAGAELRSVEKYSGYARDDYRTILAWAEYPRQARQWVAPEAAEKQKMIEADLAEYEGWLHDN
jgi:hypothetical protein